ncbi:hypothetical protein ElyMa_002094100 [Elysia marginata]|uniref:CCHC-type domain-containing protein n=1 Tax=Elysia marginata TaxID=1093978 RepID=A0AAV4FFH7_9GAST|nr:hypothetical protein ElyMa_002094100 [Elysia marginata]
MEQTINRQAKSKWGIVGFIQNVAAYNKWCITRHKRASLVAVLLEETGFCSKDDSHKDNQLSQMKLTENNVKSVVQSFESFTNPFDIIGYDKLVSLSSGVEATEEVTKDILSIEKGGQEMYKNFIQTRLIDKSVSFHAPISRNKKKTFAHLQSTVKVYIKDRTPANLCELKAVATAYVNARPNKSFAKKSEPVSFVVNSSHAQGKPAPPRNNWNTQDAEGGHAYRERNRFGSTRTRSNDRGAYGSRSLSRDRSFKPDNQYSYRKGNSGDLICYRCHGYGHTKKFCPSFKSNSESSQRWSKRQQPPKAKSGYVAEASTVKKASFHCCSAISDSNRDGVLIFDKATVCGIPKRSL